MWFVYCFFFYPVKVLSQLHICERTGYVLLPIVVFNIFILKPVQSLMGQCG
jgi:hypothetical protein